MPQANVESDPLFKLLTDALRAGPGSVEWSEAVVRFRANGDKSTDEYALLLQAREHLASGKDYKAVRAGAGFTRKLFTQIDDEKAGGVRSGVPTANLIAGAAVVAILGVLGLVAFFVSKGPGDGRPQRETLPAFFPHTVLATTFDGADDSFKVISSSPVDMSDGLRPGPAAGPAGSYVSTEVVPHRAQVAPFEVEAEVQAPPGGGNVITQLFVHDAAAGDGAIDRKNELSWVLQNGEQRVRRGEQTETSAPVPPDGKVTVRIVVGEQTAAVYGNKQLLWTGEPGLLAGPKMPGIRFLRPAGDTGEVPVIQALRIRSETGSGNDAGS